MNMGNEEGIDIKSDKGIGIECNGLLTLKAKNIQIKAPEGVHLSYRKESRGTPVPLLRRGISLNPTDIQFEVKNKAILEGRTKQAFSFEEEPRPTLFKKTKPEKKKGGWGNFFKGLGLAVIAVGAVALSIEVCVAAAPIIGGLLAAGTASMALGVGMGIGLAAGTAVTAKGAADVYFAGEDMMMGADYEEVAWRVDKGFAFIGAGYGISMTTLSLGTAAMPLAQYMDAKLAPYIDCRFFPGQGFAGRISGGGNTGIPEVNKKVTFETSNLRAGYVRTTNNDRYFAVQWGGIKPSNPTLAPVENTGNMMLPYPPNGPSQLVPIGDTGALMPAYTSNPLLNAPMPINPVSSPSNRQQMIEASNPNLYGRDGGVGGLSKADIISKALNDSKTALAEHIEYIKNGGIVKPTGGKFAPSKVSVAIDTRTGKIYYGYSGKNGFNPNRADVLDEGLQNLVDNTKNLAKNTADNPYADRESFELWSVDNCAEINAVDQALKNKAKMEDIFIRTVNFRTGEFADFCDNCKVTFKDFMKATE